MRPGRFVRAEFALLVGAAGTAGFWMFGPQMMARLDDPSVFIAIFAVLFAVMLWLSFGVVRHADCLAGLLGEPLGTLILTVAVIGIEVIMISAVMVTGKSNPALARDTMFAVLMIVLNGMIGLSMLMGAWRHGTPVFNLQGANAYLGVIVPLAAITLILPRFTTSAPGGEPSTLLAVLLITASVVLYGVFLGIQTMRHRGFFTQPNTDEEPPAHSNVVPKSVLYHALLLPLTMLPIVLLSKSMAKLVDHGIVTIGAPQALGGFIVAMIVLSPEGLSAFRAALHNQFQRTVNISLGSALATIGLTVPAVLVIGFVTGERVELGLEPIQIVLLVVTLVTMIVNAGSGRTNVLQGVVHLLLFATYAVLLFD